MASIFEATITEGRTGMAGPPHGDYAPTYEGEALLEGGAAKLICSAVALIFKVREEQLYDRNRGKAQIAFARQVAMYLAHIICGISLTEVGRFFGRDRTTVSHACRLVEDCREDPNIDLALDLIEQSVLKVWSFNDFNYAAVCNHGADDDTATTY
ncbi:MAG: hypothetical protein DHS20C08_13110 [Rhodomicrobium sp.]|nr:MAG: hypothetical protein DHS20C08_13110 [Rhodomicrobium sp.]